VKPLSMQMVSDSLSTQSDSKLHSVLIATDNSTQAKTIITHLQTIGYRTHIVIFDGTKLEDIPRIAPAATLCVFTDYIEKLPHITSIIRKQFSDRPNPIIAALSRSGGIDTNLFDSVIFPPAHSSQIANRVDSMIRLQDMEREINLRTDTLSEDFNIHHELNETALDKPYRILFIGKASPDFMVIVNALQKRHVEIVAAFTSFSAFDYLHEGDFDAVVMNALEGSEPALTITSTMRRNSRLYHVPTLFLVNEDEFQDHDISFKSGAKDIISTHASEQEIAGRILELANYRRIHSQLKQEFDTLGGEACMDVPSGTFNSAFFEKHIVRICSFYQSTNIPVSMVVVRTKPDIDTDLPSDKVERANAQIGGILKNLVRMQDIVARIEDNLYIMAILGLPYERIDTIIERISGIVDCAAFETGLEVPKSFSMTIETANVELMSHETSDMVTGRLYGKLTNEAYEVQPRPFIAGTL